MKGSTVVLELIYLLQQFVVANIVENIQNTTSKDDLSVVTEKGLKDSLSLYKNGANSS